MTQPNENINFGAYVRLIAEQLQPHPSEELRPDSPLSDWGIDSLQTFELILVTEQLAGLTFGLGQVDPIVSVGDAYKYFLTCVRMAQAKAASD